MNNLNRKAKIVAVLAFGAFLISFGLLNYHYSFDPYSWLKPDVDAVLSRDRWLERRDIYICSALLSFVAFFVAATDLLFAWIVERREAKIDLE